MAKYQTRYKERGGRPNFGDLGISSYKAQQDQIIDGLRIQSDQYTAVQKEALQSEEAKARKEIEWDNYLKELEDSRYRMKRRAISTRQETEVDALKGKAAEYGRQSKFWQGVAPKYAQMLTDIGSGLAKKAERKDKQQATKDWHDNPISKQFSLGLDINKKEALDHQSKAIENGNIEEAKTLQGLFHSRNKLTQAAAELIEDAEESFESFKNRKGEEYKDGDFETYLQDTLDFIGVPKASDSYNKALIKAKQLEHTYSVQTYKFEQLAKSNSIEDTSFSTYRSSISNNTDIVNTVHEILNHNRTKWHKAEDDSVVQRNEKEWTYGKVIPEFLDKTIEYMNPGDFYNYEEWEEKHDIQVPQNGKVGKDETLIKKLPEHIREQLKTKFHKKTLEFNKKSKEADQSKSILKVTEIEDKLKSGEWNPFDLSNKPGGRPFLINQSKTYTKGSDESNLLNSVLYEHPESIDNKRVLKDIENAKLHNNPSAFYNEYWRLDPKVREKYSEDLEHFQEWERNFGPNFLDDEFNTLLPDRKEGMMDKYDRTYRHLDIAAKVYYMQVWHKNKDKAKTYTQRSNNVFEILKKQINANTGEKYIDETGQKHDVKGEGIWRSIESPDKKKRIYLVYKNEDSNTVSLTELEAKLNLKGSTAPIFNPEDSSYILNKFVTGTGKNQKRLHIFSKDTLDEAALSLLRGTPPPENKKFNALFKAWKASNPEITKREVWNKIFKHQDYGEYYLPPDGEDHCFWTMKNSKLMTANFANLSYHNRACIAAVAYNYSPELGIMSMASKDITEPPKTDFNEAIKENKAKVNKDGITHISYRSLSRNIFNWFPKLKEE